MKTFLFSLLLLSVTTVFAQGDKVPSIVKATFTKQYPTAENVVYEDNPLEVRVNFTNDGSKLKAYYTKKGQWKNTQKEMVFDELPAAVKEGFSKSKYADREVEETKLFYRAGGTQWYVLKVKKGTLQKKYISFDETGRLVSDTITL